MLRILESIRFHLRDIPICVDRIDDPYLTPAFGPWRLTVADELISCHETESQALHAAVDSVGSGDWSFIVRAPAGSWGEL